MGALCSGKSENPTSLEPPKNARTPSNSSVAIPKVAYSDKLNEKKEFKPLITFDDEDD